MSSNMNDATVSLPYQTVRAMEDQIKQLRADQQHYAEQLQEARLSAGDGQVARYRDAFFVAFAIVQYAIGHLDPMTFRGWPYPRLFQLSTLLKELPYLPPELSEMGNDLALLARECKKWEDARALGIEQQLLAEENARHHGAPFASMDLPGDQP